MTILREQPRAAAWRWRPAGSREGLRPRVVHESGSEWIRRVDFQFPLAAMGTASGAVLVSECTDHSGSPRRAPRALAAAGGLHAGRALAGLEGGGRAGAGRTLASRAVRRAAPSPRWRWMRRSGVGGDARGVRRTGRVPARVARPARRRGRRGPAGEEEEVPIRRRRAPRRRGAAKHPNVVTSVTLDPATDTCWTTCLDGVLRRWHVPSDDDKSDSEIAEIALTLLESLETAAPALCSSLCPLERVVYVGTADGDAYAFDGEDFYVFLDGRRGRGFPRTPRDVRRAVPLGGARGGRDARAVAAAAGGCVTGSSTGPIMAWKFRRGDGTSRAGRRRRARARLQAAGARRGGGGSVHREPGAPGERRARRHGARLGHAEAVGRARRARRRARDGPRGGHR